MAGNKRDKKHPKTGSFAGSHAFSLQMYKRLNDQNTKIRYSRPNFRVKYKPLLDEISHNTSQIAYQRPLMVFLNMMSSFWQTGLSKISRVISSPLFTSTPEILIL